MPGEKGDSTVQRGKRVIFLCLLILVFRESNEKHRVDLVKEYGQAGCKEGQGYTEEKAASFGFDLSEFIFFIPPLTMCHYKIIFKFIAVKKSELFILFSKYMHWNTKVLTER